MINPAAVRQSDLVRILKTTRCDLDRWTAAGMPGVSGSRLAKRYDLHAVMPWLKSKWQGGSGVPGEPSKRAAEIDLLVARKVHLELKTRLANGELVHRDDVERGNCERIKMVRAGLEALRRALAPAVLELGENATLDDVESLIWDYVNPLLEAFAKKRKVEK